MIYTLTTNPAIDLNITTKGLCKNIVNRTYDTVYSPNGKGLNVSFVLRHFGIPTEVLGFFGGFSGEYIVKEARQTGLVVHPVWVEDTTRINIFINDGSDEYKLVNEGSYVGKERQADMLSILETAEDMEYLSISGSLPTGIEESYYEEILKTCRKRKIKVILDISSGKLKELLSYEPYLIKPNDEEIEQIFGIIVRDEEDIIDVLRHLNEMGAKNILLTLGRNGAYFYDGTQILYSNVQPVSQISSACAGDAALGGFLSIWLSEPKRLPDALKRSAAVGANVAESNGLGDFMRVSEYYNNIHIRKVR